MSSALRGDCVLRARLIARPCASGRAGVGSAAIRLWLGKVRDCGGAHTARWADLIVRIGDHYVLVAAAPEAAPQELG